MTALDYFISFCDQCRKFSPPFSLIGCKRKTNYHLVTHDFPILKGVECLFLLLLAPFDNFHQFDWLLLITFALVLNYSIEQLSDASFNYQKQFISFIRMSLCLYNPTFTQLLKIIRSYIVFMNLLFPNYLPFLIGNAFSRSWE